MKCNVVAHGRFGEKYCLHLQYSASTSSYLLSLITHYNNDAFISRAMKFRPVFTAAQRRGEMEYY
jgi:hypothetical protein